MAIINSQNTEIMIWMNNDKKGCVFLQFVDKQSHVVYNAITDNLTVGKG